MPRNPPPSPFDRVCARLAAVFTDIDPTVTSETLRAAVPRKWVRYGDLVLLPESTLTPDSVLARHEADHRVWKSLADGLGVQRVAVRLGAIASNDYRSPRVKLLLGDSLWVRHRDNGVLYSWNITRCMFSRGNITEKLRVASWDCSGEVVVDLFAGIGYFSLPVILKTGALHLHACEWNPDAVEAFRRNLDLNDVPSTSVTVHEGDNREVCPQGVAQRVLLGLLPTAKLSWRTACRALDPATGGWLHVHENVDSEASKAAENSELEAAKVTCNTKCLPAWLAFGRRLETDLTSILRESGEWNVVLRHIQFVKSYAPHVDHLVIDVQCLPRRSCGEDKSSDDPGE